METRKQSGWPNAACTRERISGIKTRKKRGQRNAIKSFLPRNALHSNIKCLSAPGGRRQEESLAFFYTRIMTFPSKNSFPFIQSKESEAIMRIPASNPRASCIRISFVHGENTEVYFPPSSSSISRFYFHREIKKRHYGRRWLVGTGIYRRLAALWERVYQTHGRRGSLAKKYKG